MKILRVFFDFFFSKEKICAKIRHQFVLPLFFSFLIWSAPEMIWINWFLPWILGQKNSLEIDNRSYVDLGSYAAFYLKWLMHCVAVQINIRFIRIAFYFTLIIRRFKKEMIRAFFRSPAFGLRSLVDSGLDVGLRDLGFETPPPDTFLAFFRVQD